MKYWNLKRPSQEANEKNQDLTTNLSNSKAYSPNNETKPPLQIQVAINDPEYVPCGDVNW